MSLVPALPHLVFGQISLDDGLHLTVPRLLLAELPWSSTFTWNGSLPHPAQLLLDLLCYACLFCPHQVFCGHVLPLLLACFVAGALGRALVTPSRWQPVSPLHTFGSRGMVLHNVTPWRIPGLRGPTVRTPCLYAPPWSGTVQLVIPLAVSLRKGAFQLEAYQILGHSGQTSTGFLALTWNL